MYTCFKCGSNEVFSIAKQVRSVDEGASVFNEYRDCHNKWRDGWLLTIRQICHNESQGGGHRIYDSVRKSNHALFKKVKQAYKTHLKMLELSSCALPDPVSYHAGKAVYVSESGSIFSSRPEADRVK